MDPLWFAFALMVLAMLLIFGWPLALHGRQRAHLWTGSPAAKIVSSALATAVFVAVFAPIIASGLISGGDEAHFMSLNTYGMFWAT